MSANPFNDPTGRNNFPSFDEAIARRGKHDVQHDVLQEELQIDGNPESYLNTNRMTTPAKQTIEDELVGTPNNVASTDNTNSNLNLSIGTMR